MPQAVVCTNDYMAFGLIDVLSRANVHIPEKLTVIGYEYAQERHLHTPILTTYQRNRPALGKAAVQILLHKLNKGVYSSCSPPRGTVIPGKTCSCGVCAPAFTEELEAVRARSDNEFLHLHSRLELKLIEAKSMEDFRLAFIGQEFLLRNVQEMSVCLYANWYTEDEPGENVISYPVYSETHEGNSAVFPFTSLQEIIGKCRHPAAYFYTPLFFSRYPRGYVVLRYDIPTTYDPVFRNWVKSVYNALEFLRMKNDIQSLLACQNLSEYHDTLTGLYNRKGFSHALHLEIGKTKPSVFCICLQIGLRHDCLALESKLPESAAAKSLAKILHLIGSEKLVSARISDQRYVIAAVNLPKEMQRVLTDRLHALLLQNTDCFRINGSCGYAVVTHETAEYQSSTALLQATENAMEEQLMHLQSISQNPHYTAFCTARDLVYAHDKPVQDIAVLCRSFSFSEGHFRRIYKSMFGLSFHQDIIRRRVLHSIALLITTELDLSAVCQRCGYENYSYFMSQFHAFTGMTPNQYRRIISAHT
ncbi:MAG: helix-turn-helix domain-containing protein, partial [Oscillospiraceae bacterium]|nr:helix-turn-helix domain-containing protein [Oscillospiraceae bacterium]